MMSCCTVCLSWVFVSRRHSSANFKQCQCVLVPVWVPFLDAVRFASHHVRFVGQEAAPQKCVLRPVTSVVGKFRREVLGWLDLDATPFMGGILVVLVG